MRRLLVVLETDWDRPQLDACRAGWEGRYAVDFAAPADRDCPWDLDVAGAIAGEAARRRGTIDGVLSTSDYPGATIAAALATELGLPGSPPLSVLRASHKYASRLAQREAAPEAVPGFWLLDARDPSTWDPPFGFPCFVKPVKGAFSVLSRVVESREALGAFLTSPEATWFRDVFLEVFDRLVDRFGLGHPARRFLAEELLRGRQLTVEAWRSRHGEGVLGVVDSTFRPGTKSFVRFDYPSDLPDDVQRRCGEAALRVAEHLGLVDTLFNVELTWDEAADALRIVEVNPRACGQFADLYAKVDGVSGYEVALALAAGDPPPLRRREGAFAAAASFPLRAFEPCRVARVPDAERVRAAAAACPGALVWVEVAEGDRLLEDRTLEDGDSHRYAIVNLGGADREDLAERCEAVRAELGIELEPTPAPPVPPA